MFSRFNLSHKFILILIAVFAIGASISGYLIDSLQHEQSEQDLIYRSRLLLETMIAVRNYTGEHINPYLKPLQKTTQYKQAFIQESAPSFAASRVFEILRRNPDYSNFEYKEAAINPTNRKHNLADEFESRLIDQFRDNPMLAELTGPRMRNGQALFYTARPIVIKNESCLACHSDKHSASAAQLATYGDQHGFGWQLGDVVAARMVYIPSQQLAAAGQKSAFTMIGMLLAIFFFTALAIHILLRRTVVEPIRYLSDATHALGHSQAQAHQTTIDSLNQQLEFLVHRKDELGVLAGDFQLMSQLVKRREHELSEFNQDLVEMTNMLKLREKEREDYNQELLNNKAYLQAILDNASDGIITLDQYGTILTCNPAICKIFGYQQDQLLGQNFNLLMPELKSHDNSRLANYIVNENSKQVAFGQEVIGLRKDYSRFSLELAISEMHLQGKLMYTAIVRDITERKQAAEIQQSAMLEKTRIEAESLAKSSFLANMSHEIRTPLAAIIGYAESVLDETRSMDERCNAVRTIIRNGNYLLHIINEILDLSKIESSNFEVCIEQDSLFDLLADVRRLVEIHAESKGLDFIFQYEFPLPENINTDSLRLKQILINLCNNAIKFTEAGHVRVMVEFIEEQEKLCFSVIDSGIGLTEEQQRNIFDEYVQADYLTQSKHGGTGLGLAISMKLAKKLGGNIILSSEYAAGSCFTLCLNQQGASQGAMLDKEPEIVIDEQQTSAQPAELPQLSGHILMAEDNHDIQGLVCYYLNSVGLESTMVENGLQAIEAAQQTEFDLILIDMQMPVMNGIQAIEKLRAKGCTTPIIMLSANAMAKDREASLAAGSNDFLSKPIERELLVQTLAKYLPLGHQAPAQDYAITSELVDTGLDDLIQRFVDSLPEMLEKLKRFLQQQDWEQLAALLHQIKGMGGSFGYPMLSELASELEADIKQQQYAEMGEKLQQLQSMHLRIKDAMLHE